MFHLRWMISKGLWRPAARRPTPLTLKGAYMQNVPQIKISVTKRARGVLPSGFARRSVSRSRGSQRVCGGPTAPGQPHTPNPKGGLHAKMFHESKSLLRKRARGVLPSGFARRSASRRRGVRGCAEGPARRRTLKEGHRTIVSLSKISNKKT
jgi:hypothetical protein